MERKTPEQIVQEIQSRADYWANLRPGVSFRSICQLFYFDLFTRQTRRIEF